MSMSVSEARTEIKKLFEAASAIESRYPDGDITNNEDAAEVKRLLTEVDGLEAKLSSLEDAEQRRDRIMAGIERYGRPAPGATRPNPVVEEILEGKRVDPGTQFVLSREYREMKGSGAFQSALNRVAFGVQLKDGTSLIEWKEVISATSGTGSSLVAHARLPGVIETAQRELSLLSLIPRMPTESDIIEYVKELAFTNAATGVAEATTTTGTDGTKPESSITFELAQQAVETIAHWTPVTNRMLSDAPALRSYINGRLLLGLGLILETQILTGAAAPDLIGILSTSGINVQGKGTDTVLDALYKARTQVRVTGKGRPQAYVLHPNDWQDVRLARENAATGTLGGYLMGPPSAVGATTIWGIPVVESEALTENTGLVGDFSMGCALFDREQAAIRVGTIDKQFVRNMSTLLAELRAAFVVFRPAMFTQITGI
jgi:HK97 family phage major capsid protein